MPDQENIENPKSQTNDQEITRIVENNALALEPGTVILKKYEIVKLLGSGGMGSVYQIKDTETNLDYAIKFLNKQQSNDSAIRRFEIEARAANKLDHPNLIKVHESALLPDGQPFFIMDLVEGESLSEVLKKHGRLSVEKAAKIFIQVGFALSYAHSNGVVHRDIKPSNIMILTPDSATLGTVVKVVDFGIAKLTGQDEFSQQTLTRTGEIFGSPLYMSPEQCLGTTVDQRSDLYSLGCVMFEALSGAPPLVGETALSTMLKHQAEAALSLKEASLGIEFPQSIERIVARLLSKDPNDRYQTAQHFTSDLVSFDCGQASMIASPEFKFTPIQEPSGPIAFSGSLKLFAYVGILLAGVLIGFFIPRSEKPEEILQSVAQQSEPAESRLERSLATLAKTTDYFSQIVPGKNERIFSFPDFSIGKIGFGERETKIAIGKVSSGPNFKGALFGPSPEFRKFPELLEKFREDDLYSLDLSLPESTSSFYDIHPEIDDLLMHSLKMRSLDTLSISRTHIKTESLSKLDLFPNLKNLWIANATVDGKELAKLKLLPKLAILMADHLENIDAVIQVLSTSKNIKYLGLRESNIGIKQIRELAKCKFLTSLDLQRNRGVTDECIDLLPKTLISLGLTECSITPDCINALSRQKHLESLHLTMSKWSNADIQRLRDALPNTKINQ